jgi:predicted acetyltransferase
VAAIEREPYASTLTPLVAQPIARWSNGAVTTLTRPSLDLYDSWARCVADFGPGHIPAAAMWLLDREPDISREYCAALIKAVEKVADTSQPTRDGVVHADSYWVTEDQVVIGFLQLRHTLNDYLLEEGGHIGYSIRPTYRRRGHATRALGLALDRARELRLDRVLVTCDDGNLISAKTIESQGGVLEDVRADKRRYWITL